MVHSYQHFHGNQNGTNKRTNKLYVSWVHVECKNTRCYIVKENVHGITALSHLVNSHFRTILWEMEFQIQTLSRSNRYIF